MVKGNLPEGWKWTTIKECATTITGRTPSKSNPEYYGNYMPLVKPPELLNTSIYSSEDNISEKGAGEARVLPVNSVLVSCIGNLGKTGINRVPVSFNQQINAVVFPNEIIPEFGFYYFQSSKFKKMLEEISSATTVSIVNKSKFISLPFPIAPYSEQERIVAKIEELFTQLDAGTAALKRVQTGLKRYKASVLKAAVEGRLLDPERQQLGEGELPEGWRWEKLGSIFTITIGGTPSRKKSEFWNGDIPWVSSGEVRNSRIKQTQELITSLGLQKSNAKLHPPGTILLAMIGEGKTRGQSAILDIYATTNQNIASILSIPEIAVPEWIYYWLQSRYEQTRKSGSGGMQYALNSARIRNFEIPLPPLPEQKRIVSEVERKLSVMGDVEEEVAAGLTRAERLRQSVLKSAFEGRLV